MPNARIDDTLQTYYEDDDFTEPWATPETVVMHHGNSKSSRMWYAWVPLLSRQYRVVRPDARGTREASGAPPSRRPDIPGLWETSPRTSRPSWTTWVWIVCT